MKPFLYARAGLRQHHAVQHMHQQANAEADADKRGAKLENLAAEGDDQAGCDDGNQFHLPRAAFGIPEIQHYSASFLD